MPLQSLQAIGNPSVPAPTLLGPSHNMITDDYQVLITGVAKNGSKVRIYLDSQLLTEFAVRDHPSGTANFAYSNGRLLSIGDHYLCATAVDSQNRETIVSNGIKFRFELPYPAPTLLASKLKTKVADPQVLVQGVAKAGSTVKVYIDGVYNGELEAKAPANFQASATGELATIGFSYQPYLELQPGKHTVYTIATDSRGKRSKISNKLTFNITEDAEEAVETAESEAVAKTEDTAKAETTKTAVATEEAIETAAEIIGDDSEEKTPTAEPEEQGTGEEQPKSNTWIWIILAVLVVAIAYWYFTRGKEEDEGLKLPNEEKKEVKAIDREEKEPEKKQETMFKAEKGKDESARDKPKPETPDNDIPPPPPNI